MYIGGSTNLKRRKIDHFKPYRINKFKHLPIYEAMLKHGRENFEFEVIERTTEKDLNAREEYYINKYNTAEDGYNVIRTAHAMSDEEYVKETHGKFFVEWNKKQWQDKDYKRKMSKQSSEVQKERLKDPNYLAEKSKQLKQYTDSIKKPVEQYDKQGNLIAIYNGVREAERATGVESSQISAVALGKPYRKSAGGFVWKYPQEKSVETIESD